MRGGIAERGGVRVGHRIIEINGQSVVATAHEKIVQALSNSVGEVRKQTLLKAVKLLKECMFHLKRGLNIVVNPPPQYAVFEHS